MSAEFKFSTGQQKLLAQMLSNDLDAHTAEKYDDGHRWHLGASVIGKECWRQIWYGFRWVKKPTYVDARGKDQKGRMLRLFNRGHKEEYRFVEWLRGMGHEVEEFDPASFLFWDNATDKYFVGDKDTAYGYARNVTGDPEHQEKAAGHGVKRKQFRIADLDGHYGGSCDGVIQLHGPKFAGLPKMLLEFKTSGHKYFDKLKDDGVRIAKPEHYTQMCEYGKRMNLRYALYMCVNKDTDEIHYEIVELNWAESENATEKARRIINSPVPPPRISDNSAYFKCKICDLAPVCHGQMKYDVNCRSCRFAQPVENGEWKCHLYNQIIPRDFVPKGCASHEEAR